MLELTQTVRIEKHRVGGDVAALTFEIPEPLETGTRPLVFVAHGLLSRKERHLELCLRLAGAGFLVCAIDALFHGERRDSEAGAALAGDLDIAFATVFSQAIIGTARDLTMVADYLGRERYGIVGHSMGGYIALRAAVTDPGAAVIVSISGNPDWTWAPDSEIEIPPEMQELMRRASPLTRADTFWPRPLLLLHGDADRTVSIDGARALYNQLAAGPYAADPDRLSLVEYAGSGHEFLPDMATRAVAWMQRFLTE